MDFPFLGIIILLIVLYIIFRAATSKKRKTKKRVENVSYDEYRDSGDAHAYDFRNSERPGDRNWRWHLNDVGGQKVALGIAGINYRIADVTDYLESASKAENSGGRYGILLEREPDNPADKNAIKVVGWIDDPAQAIHLGYLYREDAAALAKEFPAHIPLAAALWRVFSPNKDKLWIGVRLLIPEKRDPCWKA